MGDLIARLRDAQAEGVGSAKLFNLIDEAAAALEAAREDACVSLVADIRFACGDNGKRMQPELVEFIRGLAADAERYRWLRDSHWYVGPEPDGCMEGVGMFDRNDGRLDAAIDQARGKGGS